MTKDNMTRRELLYLMGIASMGLAGCGSSRNEATPEEQASEDVSDATEATPETGAERGTASAGGSLVLIFSRAGENYGVGTVEVGNTMVLAQMIAEKTSSNLFEIERVTDYPAGYDDCCDEALEEQRASARPELKAVPDISGYDTIYLGFPCWWSDLPMPVYTALEALDWNGKTICPFNTHAGSGESGMFSRVASICVGSTVTEGLTVAGTVAQNDRAAAESEVDAWLASL